MLPQRFKKKKINKIIIPSPKSSLYIIIIDIIPTKFKINYIILKRNKSQDNKGEKNP